MFWVRGLPVIKMDSTTQDIDKGWKHIKTEVVKFKNAYTAIGYFTGMSQGLLTKAWVNEYGARIPVTKKLKWWFFFNFGVMLQKAEIIIPSRPFMRQTFEKNKNKVLKVLAKELEFIFLQQSTAKMSIARIGEWYVGEVKRIFRTGSFVGNSPLTTKKKGSSRPLVDTGELRNSVTHREFGV